MGAPIAIERGPLAVGLSLGVALAAFIVFIWSGHDQALGPLDLETARRLALSLWVAAPIAGGLAAYRASTGSLVRSAVAAGLVVALAVALFPGSGTGLYTCSISLPTGPFAYFLGRLAVGGLVGGGMAVALFVTGVATRRIITVVPGLVVAAAATYTASSAAYVLFYDAVRCL
jgi:hypothetical protein